MPETSPILPRPLNDADNLKRLRSKAMASVLREERELAGEVSGERVTRRWSLKRMGLALAAISPVGALLRSEPAVAAGMRANAPQYGAPPSYMYPPKPVPPSDVPSAGRNATHNGQWWNTKNSDYKEGFLIGYKSGEDRVVADSSAIKRFKSTEIRDGLDTFYGDFRNRSILVDDAMLYVVDELTGTPDEKLAAKLRGLRAAAVARQGQTSE